MFNSAVVYGSRKVIDGLYGDYTRNVLKLTDDRQRLRIESALVLADRVSRWHPVLAVKWASQLANLTCVVRQLGKAEAIGLVLEHAEAAFRIDPKTVREALTLTWLAAGDCTLERRISALSHRLMPELRPGPWGLREEGIAYLLNEREQSKTIRERLGDFRHRVLHRPGPHDITIEG